MEEEILTAKEAAKFLKMSPIQVYRLARQGEFTVIKRGRRYVRFRRSDLLAFLERYTISKETKDESGTIRKGKHRGTD